MKKTSWSVYFKDCHVCGNMFATPQEVRKCCSRDCKNKHTNNIRKDKGSKKRTEYLKEYHTTYQVKYKIVSAPLLMSRLYINTCKLTNVLFTSRTKTLRSYAPLIQEQIQSIRNLSKYIGNKELNYLKDCANYKENTCKECDSLFLSNNSTKKFCSKKCSKKSQRRVRRSFERARLRDVKVENVNHTKVFDNYNWKCNLCGCDTPKSVRGMHLDNSPELDHIKPLSKGGEHSYDNTQLLCRLCNRNKSDDYN